MNSTRPPDPVRDSTAPITDKPAACCTVHWHAKHCPPLERAAALPTRDPAPHPRAPRSGGPTCLAHDLHHPRPNRPPSDRAPKALLLPDHPRRVPPQRGTEPGERAPAEPGTTREPAVLSPPASIVGAGHGSTIRAGRPQPLRPSRRAAAAEGCGCANHGGGGHRWRAERSPLGALWRPLWRPRESLVEGKRADEAATHHDNGRIAQTLHRGSFMSLRSAPATPCASGSPRQATVSPATTTAHPRRRPSAVTTFSARWIHE
jgi:hypothetical protein